MLPCARPLFLLLACLALAVAGTPALAEDAKTAADIENCQEDNFPLDSSIQTVKMTTYDRVGDTTTMESKIYFQKDGDDSKVLMQFDNPPDMRGAAVLMLEKSGRNDTFMYVPELQKVRRVSSHAMSGSMFGTDFTYEEFERLQGMSENGSSERKPDEEVQGRKAYVLDQVPAEDADSEYELVRSFIDQETCAPLRVQFYGKREKLMKEMTAPHEKVTKEGNLHVPREIVMTNPIEGTHTDLVVEEIDVGAKIPRKYFSQSQLDRVGR